jgi:glycosyltransferase involved in cell wall biosynthesis
LKEKFLTEKKVTVLVIGNTQNSKLEREFTMSDNDIIRLPTQNYIDLPKYYQCADLALFPKQVSLSFFDVQATGLPVIASSNNISDERLSHGNGFTYRLGNIADFRLKMEMCINMDSLSYRKMRDMSRVYIKKNFDYKDIARECTKIMESEIELHKNKK